MGNRRWLLIYDFLLPSGFAVTTADTIGRKVSIIGPAAIADAVSVIEISDVS